MSNKTREAVVKLIMLLLIITHSCLAATGNAEAEVREADQAWAKAVSARSIEQVMGFYDAEGATAGSVMPPVSGLGQIHTTWEGFFAMPNFALTWSLEDVLVFGSGTGTIAYSTGTWKGAEANEFGPYLAVWRKQRDGQWKVLVSSAWFSRESKRYTSLPILQEQ
jgi:ketosteroid isomerase-like protein